MLRIKEILRKKNITQEELAKMIGVTRSSFIKTIAGNPTLDTLKKIADALDVTVPELFAPQYAADFTAFIDYKGELKRFDSLTELESFVAKIRD
jgi:transcriptional regulator with XRE-family HTH domain